MKDCAHYQRQIESYIAGELPQVELVELREHAANCAECMALLDLNRELIETGEEIPEPDDFELRDMRDDVLARIAGEISTSRRPGFLRQLALLFRAHPLPAAAALVFIIAISLLAGGRLAPDGALDDSHLLRAIEKQAARQTGLDGYWDTPFTYSNVDARRQADGKLELSFDVARHVDLITPPDSPLARDILLHAMLDPSSMGSRMRAISLSGAASDTRLEETLIFAMHNDPEPAVRLKALSVLEEYPHGSAIQTALLTTLQTDPAVQMRLLALELLADRQTRPEMLQRAIESADLESNAAVMQYATELIREF